MIIKRLQVEHIRRHRRPAAIGFAEGLTVVNGLNEVGKSTMFTALQYAFFRRSGANGEDIARLAPWGTTGLPPQVELEFESDGATYRLTKRWGAGNRTVVDRLDLDGGWTPHREEGADDWLLGLFAAKAPGKGAFNGFTAAHLGLAHLLFAPQGRIVIRGEEKDLALNEDARGRLNALVGATAQTPEEARAIERIRTFYAESWTPKGALKAKARSKVLAAEIDEIEQKLGSLEARHRDFLELGEQYDVAQSELARRKAESVAKARELEEAIPRLTKAADLKQALNKAETTLSGASSIYEGIAKTLQRLDTLEAQRIVRAERLMEAEAAQGQQRGAVEVAEKLQQEASLAFQTANADDHALGAARDALHAAQEARLNALQRGQVAELIENVETCDRDLLAISAQLATVAPSREEVKTLVGQLERRAEIEAAIRRAETVVAVTALADITLETEDGSHTLAHGRELELRGERVAFTIPGVGSVQARGPIVDVAAYVDERAQLDEQIETFRRAFGTTDRSGLEQQLFERANLEQQRTDKRAMRDKLVAGRELTELKAQLNELDLRLAAAEGLADPETIAAGVADLETARSARIQETRAVLDAAMVSVEAARTAFPKAQAAYDAARGQLGEIDAERRALLASGTREALEECRRGVDEERARAIIACDAAKAAYEPFADLVDPSGDLERLNRERNGLEELVHEGERLFTQIETRFEEMQGEGIYAQVNTLEERVARLKDEAKASERNELADKLLHALIEGALRERSEGLSEPIFRRVGPWFEQVTGRALLGIALGQNNELQGIRFPDVATDVGWEDLSGGTADQLATLVRLAFAEIVAEDSPLPVLLDDPLVNCDPVRRERILTIIERVAQRTQVVVFTCRPEDYLGRGTATTIAQAPVEMRA